MLAEFKETMQHFISKIITDQGGLQPLGAVMLHDKSTDAMELGFIPVPGDLLKDSDSKDTLAKNVFPSVFKTMEHGDFKEIVIFAFATEIWIRETKSPTIQDNWKDLPKKEGVMIQIETESETDMIIKLVNREGQVVNTDGELIDQVVLEDHPGYSGAMNATTGKTEGRFARILRDYKQNKH